MANSANMDGLVKSALVAVLVLLGIIFLVFGAGVLIPLAVSILIWFLINAIAGVFQRIPLGGWHLPRGIALVLALAAITVSGYLVLEMLISNVSEMSKLTIDFNKSLNPLVDKIAEFAGVSNKQVLNDIFDAFGIEQLFGRIVSATAAFSGQLGVVLVYVIFLMIEQQFFHTKLHALVSNDARRNWIRNILRKIAHDVQSYIWIMTALSGLTAILSYGALLWIGVDQASFWAFLIFVLNFIPTVGSILATMLPALFALVQFQAFAEPMLVLMIVGAIQFAIGNFLQPRIAGRRLNMSQFLVILSLFVWGAIWGIVGMFLAVPLTSIVMIVLSNFESTRPVAVIMSESGDVETAVGDEDA